jgi:aminoglycoside phosphotransferase (APT) family kinase protein
VNAPSPTQRQLAPADVDRLVVASLGPDVRVVEREPLAGGGFAAVWRARLDDGRAVVVKVGPAPDVRLLRYERDLVAAEARCFRLVAERAPQVPVPLVLHHGTDRSVLDGDWLVTTAMPGRTLRSLIDGRPEDAVDAAQVRIQAGAVMAALHGITGPAFGYDGGRDAAETWAEAFGGMVRDLLADAADWGVELPAPAAEFEAILGRHRGVLDEVTRPALIYFDGWDGNLLVEPGPDGQLRLCGLVDGERFLFGDPLMDFVTAVMFGRIEDEPGHPFRVGYGPAVPVFDGMERRRLALYRMHLYLLMLVEMPSRGMTGADRSDHLAGHLRRQLECLSQSTVDGQAPPT